MYFFLKQSASGRTLQLLEAFRPKGTASPRHRVVVSLGDMPVREEWYKSLAGLITQRLHGELALPDSALPADALRLADEIILRIERRNLDRPAMLPAGCRMEIPPAAVPGQVPAADAQAAAQHSGNSTRRAYYQGGTVDGVLIDKVEHYHDTALGPLLCALHAWDVLGMEGLLRKLSFTDAQIRAATVLVTSRLHEPMSENALVKWLPLSSLPDLLGVDVLRGGTDRYYRAGDLLFNDAVAIERHLRDHIGRYWGLNRTIMLYDLTNFHFEGICAANPKARRGKNKQKRSDCPQVVLGLVFDEWGFVLAHDIFAGNTNDAKTLPAMVEALQGVCQPDGLLSAMRPTVIMDGGLASEANKKLLRDNNYHFLVNDKRIKRGAWTEEFATNCFQTIPDRRTNQQVQVSLVELPDKQERLLLCKSTGRKQKEVAIRSGAESRFLRDLDKLEKRLNDGKLKKEGLAIQAMGRLKERHSRVARYYELSIQKVADGRIRLSRKRDDQQWCEADELAGDYILRTSRMDLSGPEIWSLYMTLSKAEEGFRLVKGELGLRPNYHQKDERVDAHTFTTILAYQLLRFILHSLEAKGDHRSWRVLKRILASHCYSTMALPSTDGKTVRIRKPGRPELGQQEIYRALGVSGQAGLPVAVDVIESAGSHDDFVVTQKTDY